MGAAPPCPPRPPVARPALPPATSTAAGVLALGGLPFTSASITHDASSHTTLSWWFALFMSLVVLYSAFKWLGSALSLAPPGPAQSPAPRAPVLASPGRPSVALLLATGLLAIASFMGPPLSEARPPEEVRRSPPTAFGWQWPPPCEASSYALALDEPSSPPGRCPSEVYDTRVCLPRFVADTSLPLTFLGDTLASKAGPLPLGPGPPPRSRISEGMPCASDGGRLPASGNCPFGGIVFPPLWGWPPVVSSEGGVL